MATAVKQSTAGHLLQTGAVRTRSCTITCWVCNTGGGTPMIFDLFNGTDHVSLFDSGGVYIYGGGTQTNYPYQTSKWYFVAIRVDASGNAILSIGYSGLVGKLRHLASTTVPDITAPITWCDYADGGGFSLSGAIRSLKVWNGTRLTDAQLVAEMDPTASPIVTTNLHSWVPLPGVGDYTDHSGNSHGVTPIGTWSDDNSANPVVFATSLNGTLNVQCAGDSRTAGVDAPYYPTQLATLLGANYTVTNYGYSGQTIQVIAGHITSDMLPAKSNTVQNLLVVWCGINNLNVGDAGATCIERIRQLVDLVTSYSDYRVIVCVEIACNTTFASATELAAYQTALRNEDGPWIKCDLLASTELQNFANSTYFNADGVHPTVAGSGVVAADIAAVISANSQSPISGSGTAALVQLTASGTATFAYPTTSVELDFGRQGSSTASTFVGGQTGIAAGAQIEAWLMASTTADHNADEHSVIAAYGSWTCGGVEPGVGFTLVGNVAFPITGKVLVQFAWSNP